MAHGHLVSVNKSELLGGAFSFEFSCPRPLFWVPGSISRGRCLRSCIPQPGGRRDSSKAIPLNKRSFKHM